MSRGVLLSVVASFLFSALYFLSPRLAPLTGQEVFGWRIVFTLPCLLALMAVTRNWADLLGLLRRLKARPVLLPLVMLSSALFAVQLWLFLWAPIQGRGLQVALGYFLLPLTMIFTGRILYKERLSRLQQLAVLLAALGVANQIVQVGELAWETWVVALGYPIYFTLRRQLKTDHLGGLLCDMLLMLPVAMWFAWSGGKLVENFAVAPALYGLIPLMGVISAWALTNYILASRLLPMGLFGLLGYIEPVFLVLVAILMGERIAPEEWLTYLPIWAAVVVLVCEGVRKLLRRKPRLST